VGALGRLADTVAEMTTRLDQLRERGLRSWVEELAALHALQVQAQALIDMVMRLAAELGYSPETPRDAATALEAEAVIGREEWAFIRRLVAFRNIVVHEYASVDMELVRRIIRHGEYRRVAELASRLLEEAEKRGIDP